MKRIWKLLIPDWSHLDTIWRNQSPFCLWQVGDKPLIAHWMDEAVKIAIPEVQFYTADRPDQVREYLNEGAFWSRPTKVIPIPSDEKAPEDAVPIVGLPKNNQFAKPVESEGDLLRHWIGLHREWLDSINDYSLRIETKFKKNGWIGPHSRIHSQAKLEAPFWIQGNCDIGANATIGPYACVGENAIIDENATVQNAIVMPGTMVGRNTMLEEVAVDGGLLLDGKHGCRVSITDSFILSDLGQRVRSAPLFERLAALFLFIVFSPLAAISKMDWTLLQAHDGRGGKLLLKTGRKGPLIVRRLQWLKEVFKGRMRLIGIHPRPLDWSVEVDQELEQRLKEVMPGVLSFSDIHGCHSTTEPDEWAHAAYQAFDSKHGVEKIVRKQFWKAAFKKAS